MIAYGASVTDSDVYKLYAEKGIRLASKSPPKVLCYLGATSVARTYNLILEEASDLTGLEALVLVHQDCEIRDPQFESKVLEALKQPGVEIAGCVGATNPNGIAWWTGEVFWGSTEYAYGEAQGGSMPWVGQRGGLGAKGREVHTIYGLVLALSPWAVRSLRLEETISNRYGYDFDLCFKARDAGKKVVVIDAPVVHHHSLDLIWDPDSWIDAHVRASEVFGVDDPPADDHAAWRSRARRAEAWAGASQLLGASRQYQKEALERLEDRRLAALTETASWRITKPLRRINSRLRGRARPDG